MEYQGALPERDLTRDFSTICGQLYPVINLEQEIEDRLMRAAFAWRDFVVVDGGCGSGAAIYSR